MKKDRQDNRISTGHFSNDGQVSANRFDDSPVTETGSDNNKVSTDSYELKKEKEEEKRKNREQESREEDERYAKEKDREESGENTDITYAEPKVIVFGSNSYRESVKVTYEKEASDTASDKVSVLQNEQSGTEPKVSVEDGTLNGKSSNNSKASYVKEDIPEDITEKDSIYQGRVAVVPSRNISRIKSVKKGSQGNEKPGEAKKKNLLQGTNAPGGSGVSKGASERTKKILGLNSNEAAEKADEKAGSYERGILRNRKNGIKKDGKISTGVTSEKVSANSEGENGKVTSKTVKSTEKVTALSRLRGGETEKVTTVKNISKKVKASRFVEEEIAGPDKAKKKERISLFRKKKETAEKEPKKKRFSPAIFFSTENSNSSSKSAIIICAAIIVIATLAHVFANAFTTILGTSLLEGYNIMTDEDSGYDLGYDRATYLLTKYGISGDSVFQYDLWNSVLIGDSGFSEINDNDSIKHTVKSNVFSVSDSCVTDGAVENLFKRAAGTVTAKGENSKNVIYWFGINDVKSDVTAKRFASEYLRLIKENIPDSALDFIGKPVYKKMYVLSILDTAESDNTRVEGQAEKVELYNQALREMCAENSYFCYVDITAFLDEETYKEDGRTFSDNFYYLKLLPYLSSITEADYHIGGDSCATFNDRYGIYGFTPEGTLLNLLKFLYEYKNGTEGYNNFKGFAKMSREKFMNNDVQLELEDVWNGVFNDDTSTIYYEKSYADQQSFIIEEYYKNRLRPYMETRYSLDISGASYAFKSALVSLGYHFAYESGESFDNKEVSAQFNNLFDGINWTASEDTIISAIYENAKHIDPSNAGRWEAEKADCLSMYEGTLDMYEMDQNEFGFINWVSHLDMNAEAPEDKAKLASEDSHGTGITITQVSSDYVADHDETGGRIAEEYVAFALSFADPPELYGSGHYKLPYVWGGASLVSGADCSGFVGQILARYGYLDQGAANIHGYLSGTFRSLGTAVELSDIRVGDIVCYQGHVAIYIGGGRIVHEPSANRSCGVEIGSLNAPKLLAVRRFDMSAPAQ